MFQENSNTGRDSNQNSLKKNTATIIKLNYIQLENQQQEHEMGARMSSVVVEICYLSVCNNIKEK